MPRRRNSCEPVGDGPRQARSSSQSFSPKKHRSQTPWLTHGWTVTYPEETMRSFDFRRPIFILMAFTLSVVASSAHVAQAAEVKNKETRTGAAAPASDSGAGGANAKAPSTAEIGDLLRQQ